MPESLNNRLWKAKLAAWVHDPAEKALVLLRDRTGHEWGTVAVLREQLLGSREMPADVTRLVKRADWYASAADRPQFPTGQSDHRYVKWTQVDFAKQPVLKHPLTGEDFDLPPLADIPVDELKSISQSHFESLIQRDESDAVDWRRTQLAYWRFGPETPTNLNLDEDLELKLNHLWQNLPADTRIPDHSIWSHLDNVSAFAGAMAGDATETASLLTVSFGPVQGFIAEARSISDLWAGSHLLSCIAWEGMRVVAEQLGPDAIVFPNLRAVPLVDVWLRDDMQLKSELFQNTDWANKDQGSDANALFSAALPNRFVAIVPADQAAELGRAIKNAVQEYIQKTGQQAMDRVLEEIGEEPADQHCYTQLRLQLKDFPEVQWASIPWSLAEGQPDSRGHIPVDTRELRSLLGDFYPEPESEKPGFLGSSVWQLLGQEISVDGVRFYKPNPGALYPAIYDLLDRVASATKTIRPFRALCQEGYRSTLNGEREWLTLDQDELHLPPGQRDRTLWARLASKHPVWVKNGEHLDALMMIKRLWPTLFVEKVSDILNNQNIRRYIVSTHTLSLSVSLDQWIQEGQCRLSQEHRAELENVDQRTALPRRLLTRIRKLRDRNSQEDAELLCRALPGLMDSDRQKAERISSDVFSTKPENYYGILLFDGDRMGAWVAGNEPDYLIPFEKSWHPQIRDSVQQRFGKNQDIRKYLEEYRPLSPARHRAISEALNGFSLGIARYVVEERYKGKLVYAGGDDVMAFVCVDDLLPAMELLNSLYSGRDLPTNSGNPCIDSRNGYVRIRRHLFATMGQKATASCGAVIAHHQIPLGLVMREVRAAEKYAKQSGDRDAFCLKILKRSGGAIAVTEKWRQNGGSVPQLIQRLAHALAEEKASRRAAYHSVAWLRQLSPHPDADMLRTALGHQFVRQGISQGQSLARDLVTLTEKAKCENHRDYLSDLLMVSEFLARETRMASGT